MDEITESGCLRNLNDSQGIRCRFGFRPCEVCSYKVKIPQG